MLVLGSVVGELERVCICLCKYMPGLTVCLICTTLESGISFSPTFANIIQTVWQKAIYQKSHPPGNTFIMANVAFFERGNHTIYPLYFFPHSCQNYAKKQKPSMSASKLTSNSYR